MLQNQHAVSVGKKSVPFPDSFQIGFHDQFLARESADKHQQRVRFTDLNLKILTKKAKAEH